MLPSAAVRFGVMSAGTTTGMKSPSARNIVTGTLYIGSGSNDCVPSGICRGAPLHCYNSYSYACRSIDISKPEHFIIHATHIVIGEQLRSSENQMDVKVFSSQ